MPALGGTRTFAMKFVLLPAYLSWRIIVRLLLEAACLFAALTLTSPAAAAPPVEKARLFVLTDIEADPDDTQSLIRLLLYANEIDLEGFVATTSVHQKNRIAPESIGRVIAEYAKVRANLALHDSAYPTATALRSLIGRGQPIYGMAGVGTGKDTDGSRRLIAALSKPDKRPLWVSVWGGANTLAQTLHTIRATRSPSEAKQLTSKLRVYTISDQDDSGTWIRKQFPDLFYVVSPGGYGAGTWTGIHHTVDGIDNNTISNGWLAQHIQQGHGPLGAAYPDVAYGMGLEVVKDFFGFLLDEVDTDVGIEHVFHQKDSRFCFFGCFRSAMKSGENLSRLPNKASHELLAGISITTLPDFLMKTWSSSNRNSLGRRTA